MCRSTKDFLIYFVNIVDFFPKVVKLIEANSLRALKKDSCVWKFRSHDKKPYYQAGRQVIDRLVHVWWVSVTAAVQQHWHILFNQWPLWAETVCVHCPLDTLIRLSAREFELDESEPPNTMERTRPHFDVLSQECGNEPWKVWTLVCPPVLQCTNIMVTTWCRCLLRPFLLWPVRCPCWFIWDAVRSACCLCSWAEPPASCRCCCPSTAVCSLKHHVNVNI